MELTPIDYQGGQIWVNKEAISSRADWIYHADTGKIYCQWFSYQTKENNKHWKIEGRSPSLPYEYSPANVPYVEIGELVEDYINTVKQLILASFPDTDKFGSLLRFIHAASAKKYTEVQLRVAYTEGVNNAFSSASLDYQHERRKFTEERLEELIQSLQPRVVSIEIEGRYPNCEGYGCGRAECETNCINLGFMYLTYQKDGKTFLKVKSVQYEK